MVKNCKKSKIDFFVNYIRRADPACIKIKSKIQNMKTLSVPLKGVCWYNKVSYTLDYILWIYVISGLDQ